MTPWRKKIQLMMLSLAIQGIKQKQRPLIQLFL